MSNIIKRAGDARVERYSFSEMQPQARFIDAQNDGKPDELTVKDDAKIDPSTLEEEREAIRAKLHAAERRAQEIEKSAYEHGYAQGQKDGFEYGIKSASVVKEKLQSMLNAWSAMPEQMYRDYRDWFIAASLAVARKIIEQEISCDPGILVRMMDTVLREAEAAQSLVIRISQKDYELLRKQVEFEAWQAENAGSVSIKPDPELKTGSCCLESDIQLIDASVDTQLEMIREFFHSNVRSDEADVT